jgi:site-specific DNA-methyltransferase (adenine-specific)
MVDGKYAEPIDGLGGASRFFYCPKAQKKDRDEGMEHLQSKSIKGRDEGQDKTSIAYKARPTERKNIHPTVKPTDLMSYLVRLVTPKGGTVLDPFMGSGSTGKAAIREGMDFIGIEREDEYMEIAKSRIEHEKGKHNYRKFFDI